MMHGSIVICRYVGKVRFTVFIYTDVFCRLFFHPNQQAPYTTGKSLDIKYKIITWQCSDDDDGVYWLQGISINQQFLYKQVWNRVEDMEDIPEI